MLDSILLVIQISFVIAQMAQIYSQIADYAD